jgi:membrane glycosyltransferase
LLLYLPKLLSVVVVLAKGARLFGSGLRLAFGMLAESLFSTLAAPVRMLFHTRFVAAALLGLSHQWKSPSREDTKTRWGEALLRHGCDTLLGVGWAAALYFVDPSYLLWLSPVTGALILSIPLSVYTSRISLGRRLRRLRLLLMP